MNRTVAAVLFGLLALPLRIHATTLVVPDNAASIQAAIDAGADSVLVRTGIYEESVTITHSLYLGWHQGSTYPYLLEPPRVRRIRTTDVSTYTVTVEGLHVLGGVRLDRGSTLVVRMCRADSGMTCGFNQVRVMSCLVFGDLVVSNLANQVLFSTVVGGKLSVVGGTTNTVASNFVAGPSPVGIEVGVDVHAHDNVVRGCVDGIHVTCDSNAEVRDNLVTDCSGDGIAFNCSRSLPGPWRVRGNTIRRCGGIGLHGEGWIVTGDFNSNTIDSTGNDGIRLAGTIAWLDSCDVRRAGDAGIRMTGMVVSHLSANRVLRSGGDGISVTWLNGKVDHNVVGRNGGRGIAATAAYSGASMVSNTSYENGLQGLDFENPEPQPVDITANIGFANSRGVRVTGAGSATLGCNDWFGNSGGATEGIAPGPSDFDADPLFCNLHADVVTLASMSPALSHGNCGLVGALGLGCPTPTSVPAATRLEDARLRVFPQPNHGAMRFAWTPQPEPLQLEVFDAQGALRFSRGVGAGTGEVEWSMALGDRSRFPAGVYFARLRDDAGERGTCRVVMLR